MPVVFVDSKMVQLADGMRAIDAVRALDAGRAAEVEAGKRAITDSRGLPVEASAPVYEGAIFRVIRAK